MIASIAATTDSGKAAADAIYSFLTHLEQARQLRVSGGGVKQVLEAQLADDTPLVRLQLGEAMRRFDHEIRLFRASVVRVLVDEEQMTLSAVARRLNVSRQLVTRLYGMTSSNAGVPKNSGP